MEIVNGNVKDISLKTEQLSTGMEETSAASEQMNVSAHEIESEVVRMKEKTMSRESLAKEIKGTAGKLKEETINSHKYATDIHRFI